MTAAPATTTPAARTGFHLPGFAQLQRLGKSLMLPIALLPVAGLLLRLGQEDLLGQFNPPVLGALFDSMSAAGGAIFANLPLFFAVGVAIGFARKADGSTALAAVAGYVVIEQVFQAMSPVVLQGEVTAAGGQAMINYSVLAGIVIGLVTAALYDRYHEITLPPYLGFFGGRRFVPIIVSFAALVIGMAMSWFYPVFSAGLTSVATFIGGAGALGAFVYGFVNRMLIPLGLHHIVNTYIWFVYGDLVQGQEVVTGELSRFAAGDPEAGRLTAGFYPVLMFGLPAAALAMIHSARANQRKVAVGILSAAGLTAFLTGITEPLEFAFMFVAFPLYVLHALLTGLSLAVAYTLDIHLGFSFSAGLVDLLLYGTAPSAKNIPLLLVMGVVFFVLYYAIFRFAITRWNMRTPGRESDDDLAASGSAHDAVGGDADRTEALIAAFGGRDNLEHVDACITRLRIEVADKNAVDHARLKALGAAGVIEVGNNVQAIFGTQADAMRSDINAALAAPSPSPAARPVRATGGTATVAAPAPTAIREVCVSEIAQVVQSPLPGRVVDLSQVPDATFAKGLVGHGVAIDPPRDTVDALAPVTGTVFKLWPHAFVVITDDQVAVLTHLGLDTAQLHGRGFTTHVAEGDRVQIGDRVVSMDVAQIEATGRNPVVPVVVLDTGADAIAVAAAAEAQVRALDTLFTVTH